MKEFIIPQFLNPKDKIYITTISKFIDVETINDAIQKIYSWGFNVVLSPLLGSRYHQFSATDKNRTEDLQKAIDNDEYKAILFARGGYGAIRIIDNIDFENFVKKPKFIIGFSDISVLHNAINNLNIASIHGPMPITFNSNSEESLEFLKNTILGNFPTLRINKSKFNKNIDFNNIEAKFLGGNLSIIYSLLGTKYNIDTSESILYIEDLQEYYYHLDRMLFSLKLSGMFNNIKALVIGGFTEMLDNEIPFGFSLEEIVLNVCKEFDFPIIFNLEIGHIKENKTIINGMKANLINDNDGFKINYCKNNI